MLNDKRIFNLICRKSNNGKTSIKRGYLWLDSNNDKVNRRLWSLKDETHLRRERTCKVCTKTQQGWARNQFRGIKVQSMGWDRYW